MDLFSAEAVASRKRITTYLLVMFETIIMFLLLNFSLFFLFYYFERVTTNVEFQSFFFYLWHIAHNSRSFEAFVETRCIREKVAVLVLFSNGP